jgi:ABC-type branched-subunit amino acid transport system ATPase component
MSSEFILNIESIKKSFVRDIVDKWGKSNDERLFIIDDLDLMVSRGKITALIGGNGAGKTTLFNIISGLTNADSGTILYKPNGTPYDLMNQNPFNIARLGIGRMFQDSHIFLNMTVLENMLIADSKRHNETPFYRPLKYRRLQTEEKLRIQKVESIFKTLFGDNNPFWEKREQQAGNLSYGQQRLLGLARLLMGDYQLLLLDEPTAGVNPSIIETIKEIVTSFVEKRGMTVFLIEHNMKVVLELADFCCFMSDGKIAAFGTPEDVIGEHSVRKTYMGI